jgi:hypothetical protein
MCVSVEKCMGMNKRRVSVVMEKREKKKRDESGGL